eukprot:TRINITY_DN34921_c0_g1_i5.p3 TRINITY_DN34921_c0_g1~~TRINITY_DN34921_c0_g1_i5.p3  ORF type:complete len:100 (+),score=1.20 TRINITY_DN34921_c0_g1_i5:158-457(+)
MPVICIGPCCIPLHLLLPFLIGVLHRYGFFKWFKQEWVTFQYWSKQYAIWRGIEVNNGKKYSNEVDDNGKHNQEVVSNEKHIKEDADMIGERHHSSHVD